MDAGIRDGFHFGLEAEFLLVDASSFRPLWYADLQFEMLLRIGVYIAELVQDLLWTHPLARIIDGISLVCFIFSPFSVRRGGDGGVCASPAPIYFLGAGPVRQDSHDESRPLVRLHSSGRSSMSTASHRSALAGWVCLANSRLYEAAECQRGMSSESGSRNILSRTKGGMPHNRLSAA
jgi:hypothetical protein